MYNIYYTLTVAYRGGGKEGINQKIVYTHLQDEYMNNF